MKIPKPGPETPLPDAAEMYGEAGIEIFPCEPRGKRPIGRLVPHGLLDATSDIEQIRRWWRDSPDANIGCAVGATELVVNDIDLSKTGNGPDGFDGWRALNAGHEMPDCPMQRTGSGGVHIFWLAPEGEELSNSAGKLAMHVDVRAGNGYVILPPSVHETLHHYLWIPSVDEVPPLPEHLLELI